MRTEKEKIMELTYEIYSKNNTISFDEFFNKIIYDEKFGLEFDKLWNEAKEILIKTRI